MEDQAVSPDLLSSPAGADAQKARGGGADGGAALDKDRGPGRGRQRGAPGEEVEAPVVPRNRPRRAPRDPYCRRRDGNGGPVWRHHDDRHLLLARAEIGDGDEKVARVPDAEVHFTPASPAIGYR